MTHPSCKYMIFCILNFSLLPFLCQGQNQDTLYFNRKWEQVTTGEKYKYQWILDKDIDSLNLGENLYINGFLQIKEVLNASNKFRTGKFISYKKNGNQNKLTQFQYDLVNDTIKDYLLNKYEELKTKDTIEICYIEFYKWRNYVSGIIVNNLGYGPWTYLNKKRELSETTEYSNGKKNGYAVFYFDSKDKVDKSDYGKVWLTGNYKDGKRDGLWTYYEPNKTIYLQIKYNNGKKVEEIKY